ncbi:unnamed protein product [Durusdinium trenchii]|uniref:Uracil-DNA glycosylase-like domain-containing protein n=1 Tax=Durusdinium trenchii TaxID=1381693 RepID=A0ABP0IAY7_9DINO
MKCNEVHVEVTRFIPFSPNMEPQQPSAPCDRRQSVQQLWQRFDRANLLAWYPGLKKRAKKHSVSRGYKLHSSDGDVFPMKQARQAAASMDLSKYRSVLLLGTSVARAFGLKGKLLEVKKRDSTRLVTFPHPSGVSHFWNDKENRRKALKVLKAEMKSMEKF